MIPMNDEYGHLDIQIWILEVSLEVFALDRDILSIEPHHIRFEELGSFNAIMVRI